MSGLLRFWLFALSAFEAITLARYINGGANAAAFNEVMPLHREASPTAGHLWAFVSAPRRQTPWRACRVDVCTAARCTATHQQIARALT